MQIPERSPGISKSLSLLNQQLSSHFWGWNQP